MVGGEGLVRGGGGCEQRSEAFVKIKKKMFFGGSGEGGGVRLCVCVWGGGGQGGCE